MSVGVWVRQWRVRRRMSQADLADQAQVSARHLSCIERGRASPSRQMVLVLASALEIPLRERNLLLGAAGFAPVYRHTDLTAPEMTQVRRALELMLRNAEPYPAVVVDRRWNLVLANGGWDRLVAPIVGRAPLNLLQATFEQFRPFVTNWEEVARSLLERVRREASADGDEALMSLHDTLAAQLPPTDAWDRPLDLVLPVRVTLAGRSLSLFTTLTTLGTAVDVTLSELRIEQYHPADEQTDRFVRGG
ncbi:MAG: helix-turn-helix transcriptional regulator [Myxococcota bacterium]